MIREPIESVVTSVFIYTKIFVFKLGKTPNKRVVAAERLGLAVVLTRDPVARCCTAGGVTPVSHSESWNTTYVTYKYSVCVNVR